MLAFLDGVVAESPGEGRIVLRAGTLGLTVDMPPHDARSLRFGEKVRVHTVLMLNPQEGKLSCYGFLDEVSRDVFTLLLKSPGVGPKAALSLLGMGTAPLIRAIEQEQLASLTSVPGIGAKTAQRLVLELKGKFAQVAQRLPEAEVLPAPQAEVTQALVGLGFREAEVLAALNALSSERTGLAELPLEELLRILLERLRR